MNYILSNIFNHDLISYFVYPTSIIKNNLRDAERKTMAQKNETSQSQSIIPTLAALHKLEGGAHFASSNYDSSHQSYQLALSCLLLTDEGETKPTSPRSLHWPEQERFALACHSNAALCLLRLSRYEEAAGECANARSLPIFQVAATERMREKVLARHVEAMLDWREAETGEVDRSVGVVRTTRVPSEEDIWSVLDECCCRGYLVVGGRGGTSVEVCTKFLQLGSRLGSRSSSIGSNDDREAAGDFCRSEARGGIEAWLAHLVRVGIVTTTAAEMARKAVNDVGGDLSFRRALDTLEVILPEATCSVQVLCQTIIDLIIAGSSDDAASTIKTIITEGYIHSSAIDDDKVGHLIWAACFGLNQCKGDERQTDAFIAILALLVDELGVNIDQRSPQGVSCCRNPLQFVAKAANPRAVRAMLDRGAKVDLRDEEGWTALGSTFMGQDDRSSGPSLEDQIETATLLLDAGADVEAISTTGFTPLLISCLKPHPLSLKLLILHGANRHYTSLNGFTAATLIEEMCEKNPKLLNECREVLLVDDDDGTVTEDVKAFRFDRLMNRVLLPINNSCHSSIDLTKPLLRNVAIGYKERAEQEMLVLGALMKHLGMNANLLQQRISPEDGNWLEILHTKIKSITPKAYLKTYCNSLPTEQELNIMMSRSGSAIEAANIEDSMGVKRVDREAARQKILVKDRDRGLIFSDIMIHFVPMVIDPIQHSVGYAVPTNDVLQRIKFYGPVVEVGAGTGYWSAVLRGVGVDTIAYDAYPPSANQMKNTFFSFTYTDVEEGDGTVLFDGEKGAELAGHRTLLVVWPNRNDREDNPHLYDAGIEPPIWDADCLSGYLRAGGSTVVYVGEREENISVVNGARPECGISSSRRFQHMLKEHFRLVEQHDCPQWFLFKDDVTIWKRM